MVHDPDDPNAIGAGSRGAPALHVPGPDAPVEAQPAQPALPMIAQPAPDVPMVAQPALHAPFRPVIAATRNVCPKLGPEAVAARTMDLQRAQRVQAQNM